MLLLLSGRSEEQLLWGDDFNAQRGVLPLVGPFEDCTWRGRGCLHAKSARPRMALMGDHTDVKNVPINRGFEFLS